MKRSTAAHSSTATLWCTIALLAGLLAPSVAAAAPTVPVVVRITELVQLNHDQDPGFLGVGQSLGDFYASVSINGVTVDNAGALCDNPPATFPANNVFDVPYMFFSFEGPPPHPPVDSSCPIAPWTFTVPVPLSDIAFKEAGIDIVMRIKDRDSGSDDDTPATISLKVPFGGRWTGTVDWPDNCNREAVAGSGARVCWQIEVGKDSDGDGLLDDWEVNGIDVDGDGVIDLDLPAMGANPMHKDLFIELDWRADSPPQRAEIALLKQAFAAAPIDAGGVPNPDGLPGITLHVDTGNLTEGGVLVGDNLGGGNALAANFPACSFNENTYRAAKAANFDAFRRSLAFRYGITSRRCCQFGANVGLACDSDAQCAGALCQPNGGQAEIGGNDFIVWNTVFQGSTLMHEIGHTLNLRHGGADDDNCKPNYLSVMNYDHFVIQRLDGTEVIDYSPPRQPSGARGSAPLDPLAENALDESAVLDPADPQSLLVYTDVAGRKRQSPVGARVDWNGDGDTVDDGITVNIDTNDAISGYPDRCENTDISPALTGHDDWLNASLSFLQFGQSAASTPVFVDTPEPTDEQILSHRLTLNSTDLAVTTSGPPGPYEAGVQVTLPYTVQVVNHGPNPALPARVRDTPPPGALVLAHDPRCVQNSAGQLTCDLAGFLSGTTTTASLSVLATAGCQGGVPTPIVNRARVDNAAQYAGPDPQPGNNVATAVTEVVDTTPPDLALSATPARLWPPNHQFVPVTINVTSSDVCDDSPTIRLVSITSNEAANAKGSGNTSPDVRGAAFGTDDRQFELRAERSGGGSGRIYTITYEAEDGSGNKTTRRVVVTVPKSQASP